MVTEITEKSRKRVNGSMLSQNVGEAVCLLGEVIQMDPSGRFFKLKASDNQLVTVQLHEPVQEILEGFIEVQGIAAQNNTVQCQSYVNLSSSMTGKFDLSLYNEVIKMMALYPTHYIIKQ